MSFISRRLHWSRGKQSFLPRGRVRCRSNYQYVMLQFWSVTQRLARIFECKTSYKGETNNLFSRKGSYHMSQEITLPSRCPWQFVMTVKSRSDDRNLVTFIRQTREKHNNLPVQWNLRTLRLKSENTMEKLLSLLVILTLECLPLSSNQEEIKTNIVKLPPIRWRQL